MKNIIWSIIINIIMHHALSRVICIILTTKFYLEYIFHLHVQVLESFKIKKKKKCIIKMQSFH